MSKVEHKPLTGEVFRSGLDELARRGARRMIERALPAEAIAERLGDPAALVAAGAVGGRLREALPVLLGEEPAGLSPSALTRLLSLWQEAYATWRKRPLSDRDCVQVWVDGVRCGALGSWAALRQVFPRTKEQRCWVHKLANVLDKLPESQQPKVKAMLREAMNAPSRKACDQAIDDRVPASGAGRRSRDGGRRGVDEGHRVLLRGSCDTTGEEGPDDQAR